MSHRYQPELELRLVQPPQREPGEPHVAFYVAEHGLHVDRALLPKADARLRAQHRAGLLLERAQPGVHPERPSELALGVPHALLAAGAALAFAATVLAVLGDEPQLASRAPDPPEFQPAALRARVSVVGLLALL